MAINYTQTDDNATCSNGAYCSGETSKATQGKQATEGGTAGTVEVTTANWTSTQTAFAALFGLTIDAGTTGASGTWTVRLNVTASNMNLTISAIHICRVNSSCANQETIGSATGLSISLGTTGVKTQTVTGSAVTLGVGDGVMVGFTIVNGAMTTQAFGFTPSVNIDSPFTAAPVEKTPYSHWRQTGPTVAM